MSEWTALELLDRLAAEGQTLQGATVEGNAMELVLAAAARLKAGHELVDDEAAAVKAVLMLLHARLERTERDLIRHLKFESATTRTWEQVAQEFGGAYRGRAGVFNRWTRLNDERRRTTTMNMHRGAAVPRRRDTDQ